MMPDDGQVLGKRLWKDDDLTISQRLEVQVR